MEGVPALEPVLEFRNLKSESGRRELTTVRPTELFVALEMRNQNRHARAFKSRASRRCGGKDAPPPTTPSDRCGVSKTLCIAPARRSWPPDMGFAAEAALLRCEPPGRLPPRCRAWASSKLPRAGSSHGWPILSSSCNLRPEFLESASVLWERLQERPRYKKSAPRSVGICP